VCDFVHLYTRTSACYVYVCVCVCVCVCHFVTAISMLTFINVYVCVCVRKFTNVARELDMVSFTLGCGCLWESLLMYTF
jgi:hypothetical protein